LRPKVVFGPMTICGRYGIYTMPSPHLFSETWLLGGGTALTNN
jgi:hypothetical protein